MRISAMLICYVIGINVTIGVWNYSSGYYLSSAFNMGIAVTVTLIQILEAIAKLEKA